MEANDINSVVNFNSPNIFNSINANSPASGGVTRILKSLPTCRQNSYLFTHISTNISK